MTTADLLSDSTFSGFLSLWVQHREPPIPLIDYLTEMGMEGQAEVVRWVLEQGMMPVYAHTECGRAKGTSLTYPVKLGDMNLAQQGRCWSWVALRGVEDRGSFETSYMGYADRIEWLKPNVALYADFATVEEALCYLMDGFEGLVEWRKGTVQTV